MGKTHFVVEEKLFRSSGSDDCGDDGVVETGSPPEMIYQHFANRRSPGGDRWRRQRRREQERLARRKWEPQHFVKIVNCSPTPARPLQGLWKVVLESWVSIVVILLNCVVNCDLISFCII